MKKIIMLVAGLVLGASAMAQTVVVTDHPHNRAVRQEIKREVRQDMRHERHRMHMIRQQERMRMMRERERMRMMRQHRHHRDYVR